jgi:hypothetical protein
MLNTIDLVQSVLDNTGLLDRIQKNVTDNAVRSVETDIRAESLRQLTVGHDESRHATVLEAIEVLGTLPYRAWRKSCVEALQNHFGVTGDPEDESADSDE